MVLLVCKTNKGQAQKIRGSSSKTKKVVLEEVFSSSEADILSERGREKREERMTKGARK